MTKYHKELGFPIDTVNKAHKLIDTLNSKKVSFSSHALTELSKEVDAVNIGKAIIVYKVCFNDVFEIVEGLSGSIEKIGIRIDFDAKNDIVFMVSSSKVIITAWINKKDDKHYTLNKNNYFACRP